jgi:hypothetical protein
MSADMTSVTSTNSSTNDRGHRLTQRLPAGKEATSVADECLLQALERLDEVNAGTHSVPGGVICEPHTRTNASGRGTRPIRLLRMPPIGIVKAPPAHIWRTW